MEKIHSLGFFFGCTKKEPPFDLDDFVVLLAQRKSLGPKRSIKYIWKGIGSTGIKEQEQFLLDPDAFSSHLISRLTSYGFTQSAIEKVRNYEAKVRGTRSLEERLLVWSWIKKSRLYPVNIESILTLKKPSIHRHIFIVSSVITSKGYTNNDPRLFCKGMIKSPERNIKFIKILPITEGMTNLFRANNRRSETYVGLVSTFENYLTNYLTECNIDDETRDRIARRFKTYTQSLEAS